MEYIKGRYCKDCIIYSDTLEQDARSIIYRPVVRLLVPCCSSTM